jgi:hypothetical protein
MSKHIVTFDQKPFYISETHSGVFYVVKAIEMDSDEDGKQSAFCDYDDDIGQLLVGMQIREIPNRGVTFVVRVPEKQFRIPYWIEECRKAGAIAGCDYVSIEKFGMDLSRFLKSEGDIRVHEVRPRYFRKIVDD